MEEPHESDLEEDENEDVFEVEKILDTKRAEVSELFYIWK